MHTQRGIAAAYAELPTPRSFNLTTFPNDAGYDELVLARDIPLSLWVAPARTLLTNVPGELP